MTNEEIDEYNELIDALEVIRLMFEQLDKYREKKEERYLYKCHDYERKARKKMKEILEKQNTQPIKKQAA